MATPTVNMSSITCASGNRAPAQPPLGLLRDALRRICAEISPPAGIVLKNILTDSEHMLGSQLGARCTMSSARGCMTARSAGFLISTMNQCGPYRAVVVASEPISHEARALSLWGRDDYRLEAEKL